MRRAASASAQDCSFEGEGMPSQDRSGRSGTARSRRAIRTSRLRTAATPARAASPPLRTIGPDRARAYLFCPDLHGSHEKGGDIAVAPRSPDFDPSALPRRGWPSDLVSAARSAKAARAPGFAFSVTGAGRLHPEGRRGSGLGGLLSFAAETARHRIGRVVPARLASRGTPRLPAGSRPALPSSRKTAATRRVDLHPTGSNDRFPNGTNHHDPIVSF
jgi:hypothetical protein